MTDKEAAFLLSACRPNGADDADPEFAEALAQAARDPALKAWTEDQRRFDSAVAARLQSAPVPADLRERILAGGRVSRPARWFTPGRLWAIAAMIALFAGASLWQVMKSRRDSEGWETLALSTIGQLQAREQAFDAQSPDATVLEKWLSAKGSPSTTGLPPALQRLASIGCKMVSWNGHPMSIICFHLPDGNLVHLAMVDRSALDRPPPDGHPVFETRDGWQMACWSQDGMSMMLATEAPQSQLHEILGLLPLL